jgi:hypothetical protein
MIRKDILRILSPILALSFVIAVLYLGKMYSRMIIADTQKIAISGIIDSLYIIRGDGGYTAKVKTGKGYEVFPLKSFVPVALVNKEVSIGDSIIKDNNKLEIWIIKNDGKKTRYHSQLEDQATGD